MSVPFTFWDDTTPLGSADVDQTNLRPDATNGDYHWQSLGVVSLPAGATTLTVKLDATTATGTVVADAVWVVEAVPATFTAYDAAATCWARPTPLAKAPTTSMITEGV